MYWEPGTQYNYGNIVEYQGVFMTTILNPVGDNKWLFDPLSGHRYKIIQPHFSQVRRYLHCSAPFLCFKFVSDLVDDRVIGRLVPLLLLFGDV